MVHGDEILSPVDDTVIGVDLACASQVVRVEVANLCSAVVVEVTVGCMDQTGDSSYL